MHQKLHAVVPDSSAQGHMRNYVVRLGERDSGGAGADGRQSRHREGVKAAQELGGEHLLASAPARSTRGHVIRASAAIRCLRGLFSAGRDVLTLMVVKQFDASYSNELGKRSQAAFPSLEMDAVMEVKLAHGGWVAHCLERIGWERTVRPAHVLPAVVAVYTERRCAGEQAVAEPPRCPWLCGAL